MEYQQNDNYDYGYEPQQPLNENNRSKGLTIILAVLLVVIAGLAVWLIMQGSSLAQSEEELQYAKEQQTLLTQDFQRLTNDLDSLSGSNEELQFSVMQQRFVADSLMTRLRSERNISANKIRAYERELNTLRSTMKAFVHQIDSLNQINRKLTGENLTYRKEISNLRVAAEAATETASELNAKIKRGAVIRAREITLRALNKRDKEVTRARTAQKLVTSFVLGANELATPGVRTVYVRLISPDGFDLVQSENSLFEYDGSMTPYAAARGDIEYNGEDLAVSVFYESDSNTKLTEGQYTVYVYMDGHLIRQK